MKYYKYLNYLDWKPLSEKLKLYIINSGEKYLNNNYNTKVLRKIDKDNLLNQIPEIKNFFDSINLTISSMTFFITGEKSLPIHIDYTKVNARIAWPVLNCENTETRFYYTPALPELKYQTDGVPYWYIDSTLCSYVDVYRLNCPVAFKVAIPHHVFPIENLPNPRVSCIFEFKEEIIHLIDD